MSADENIARDLRRRREASRRLPPLADVRRDPLDPKPDPKRRRIVSVVIDNRRDIALIRGWPARDLVRELGLPVRWSESGRGYVVDAKWAQDVLAMAQLERLLAVVREVGGGS